MRKIIVFILLLVILGVLGYNYLYQDHRDISTEKPDIEITSQEISNQFTSNSVLSEQKYIDKVIQVSGMITEINELDLTIDDAVFCQFKDKIDPAFKVGDNLTLKGRCIGYDDLLEQVKLNESIIIK
jgi:hypothetical protein